MKHIWLIFLCLFAFSPLTAQVLNGKIYAGIEERPLEGVDVRVRGFTQNQSDDFGEFSIQLHGKARGSLINLSLLKNGYSVINREALKPRVPDNDETVLDIYMCPSAQRSRLALQHYKIQVEQTIQRNYKQEAKVLADNMNYEAIAELTQKKEIAENMADSLAARLARFDPDKASEELTRAMQLYREGNIASALSILNPDKIIARIEARKDIVSEMQEANEYDIQALLRAADIALTDLQFGKAQNYYEKTVEADTTNFRNIWTCAFFLFNQNKSDKIIPYARMMLRNSTSVYETSIALELMGVALTDQNKPELAITAFQEARDIRITLAETNPQIYKSGLSIIYNNLGNAYLGLSRYGKAISSYKQAIDIEKSLLKANSDRNKARLGMTLNNLGSAYAALNRDKESVLVFEEALEIYRNLSGKDPDRYQGYLAGNLDNLGTTYKDLNRYDSAVAVYMEALEIRRNLAKTNPDRYQEDVATTLNNLGIVYRSFNQNDEARVALEEALEIRKLLAQENPERYKVDVATTLNNLGVAYKNLNRHKDAIASYEETLTIYKSLATLNPDQFRADIARVYNNLGASYEGLDRYTEAIDACKYALEIRRTLAKENPERHKADVATTLNNLGVFYRALDQYEPAISAYEEALEISRNLSKKNPERYQSDVAITLNNLGVIFRDLNRKDEAISAYMEALSIRRASALNYPQAFGSTLGDVYYNLGLIYKDETEFPTAIRFFEQADSSYALSLTNEDTEKSRINAQYQIGELSRPEVQGYAWDIKGLRFYQAKQRDSASIYFQKAKSAYESIPFDSLDPQGHYTASLMYEHLSYLEDDNRKNYPYLKAAVKHRTFTYQAYPENDKIKKDLASGYYNLSWFALFAEDFEEAEQAARKCLELNPNSTGVVSNLGLALLFQGKYQEAVSIFDKWKKKPWVDERYETFRQVFLADLKELEEAGIKHPNSARVRELLENE